MGKIVNHEERRAEIVEVARRLIMNGGFEAVTMRSMAAEAGYAHGALKYYFPEGRSAIVGAAFESLLAEVAPAAQDRAEAAVGGRLRSYLRSWFPDSAAEIANGRLFVSLWEHAMANPDLAVLYRTHLEAWKLQVVLELETAVSSGAITRADRLSDIADEYLAFMMGTLVTNLMYPEGGHLKDIDTYIDGLMVRLGATG